MNIKLNAKLSAYGKLPSPKSCNIDTITKDDIDSLFGKPTPPELPDQKPTFVVCEETVTKEDIDSLFGR